MNSGSPGGPGSGGSGGVGGVGSAGRRRADSLTTPADTRRAELHGLEPGQMYQVGDSD